MTTPYQAAPDGAVTIGGGTWNYGQTLNEDIGRAAFEVPQPTPDNMLDILRIVLERLPIDALKPFADFLGIVDGVFTTIGEAVDAIIDSLGLRPVFLALDAFNEWLAETFVGVANNALNAVTDLGVLIGRLWSEPWAVISEIPQALVNGLTGIANNVSELLGDFGQLVSDLWNDPGNVLRNIPQAIVDGLSGIATNVTGLLGDFGGLLDDLWNDPGNVLRNIPQAIVDGLTGIADNVSTFVADFGQLLSDLWNNPAAVIGALPRAIIDGLQGLFDQVSELFGLVGGISVQTIVDDVSQIIQDAGYHIDGFIRGLLGWIGSGFQVDTVEEVSKRLADSIASMNAAITKLLQEADSGDFSGTAVSVDFQSYPNSTTMGSAWAQSYPSGSGTGTLGVSAGRVAWQGQATDRRCVARFLTNQCRTDYQKVGAAFATVPSINFLGGYKSRNTLIARANTTMNTYTYVDLMAESLELGCYVNGAKTIFYTDTTFRFKPGSSYWLECGTTGGARILRVWENKRVILTRTDSSSISQIGASYRNVGLGVQAANYQYVPAEIAAFAFFDNDPMQIKGCGWRVMRTDTANTASFTATESLFPQGWFNTVDYMSDDLIDTYDPVNNKIVAPADGWYAVSVYQYGNQNLGPGVGGSNRAGLFKNGTCVQLANPIPSNINVGYNGFGGTFTVYCEKGDELQPGYSSTWSGSNLLRGEAGGLGTYWAGAFLGNKKAV